MNELVEEYKYIKSAKTEWKFVNFKNFWNVLESFEQILENIVKILENFKNFKDMFKFLKILNNKWKGISRHPNGGVCPFVPFPT